MALETLFNKGKNGKIKKWDICVNKIDESKSVIVTTTGFIDGKMTIFEVIITNGKNIGKSNETSIYEQAFLEANSKWNKKVDSGYTIDRSGISSETQLVFPMLAMNFDKDFKKIQFPNVFCQPKLDGVRAVYENGSFHSRKLKLFPHLDHIENELKNANTNGLLFDGELYSDLIPFQVISGIVSKKTLNEIDRETITKIQFRVYDIISDLNFKDRFNILSKFFKENSLKNVFLVETTECNDAIIAKEKHDNYVKNGYEGLMLRNKIGGYEINTRSYNLQKYKSFDDSEYKVVSFKDGVGKESGAVIWVFTTKDNKLFDSRPIGSISERKRIYKIADQYIDKFITVKHFGLTDNLIPRFPVSNLLPRID